MVKLEERVEEAMIAILQEHTFYWTILQKLKRVFIDTNEALPCCTKAATDGFSQLVFNREGCDHLTMDELIGLCLHECLHVAHLHPMRANAREHTLWNIACDYAVNDLIFEQGLSLPENALYDARYDGWAPEEIYETLERQREEERQAQNQQQGGQGDANGSPNDGTTSNPSDEPTETREGDGQGGNDDQGQKTGSDQGGSGDDQGPAPLSSEDGGSGEGRQTGTTPTELTIDWTHGDLMTDLASAWEKLPPEEQQDHKQKIEALRQRAIMIAQSAGKDTTMCEVSNRAADPPLDWKSSLRAFVLNSVQREDYTWSRPNRRFVPQGVYLPSLTGTYDPESIVLGIDNSGSISRSQLDLFMQEIASLMVELPTTIFHVICCDTRVNGYHKLTSNDLPLTFEVEARGGTRFTPLFREVEELDILPEALIYFTDMGSSDYPSEAPQYPVMWLNYGPILPNGHNGIKEAIRSRQKYYKKYHYEIPDLTDEQWRQNIGMPPFGDPINMLTSGTDQ